MVSLFLLLGCNLSYIVDLFAALHELASASARTLLKLASSLRALLKPYGDTLETQRLRLQFNFILLSQLFLKVCLLCLAGAGITRSLQLPHIPVTAFSQTDLFSV